MEKTSAGDTTAVLWDVEGSYLFSEGPLKNFEFIADYGQWHFSDPEVISKTDVGDIMRGCRLELAYHRKMGANELIPFFRAEGYDFSEGGGKPGFVEGPSYNYLTYGAMYKFGNTWELKAGVRQSLDDDDRTELNFGVGFQF